MDDESRKSNKSTLFVTKSVHWKIKICVYKDSDVQDNILMQPI